MNCTCMPAIRLRVTTERTRHSIQSEGIPCFRMVSRSTTCTSSRRGVFLEPWSCAVVSLSWNCDDSGGGASRPASPLPKNLFSSPIDCGAGCESWKALSRLLVLQLEQHPGAGEFQHVVIRQHDRFGADVNAIERGTRAAVQMRHVEAVAPVGHSHNGYAGFAESRNRLDHRHLQPRRRARQDAKDGVGRLARAAKRIELHRGGLGKSRPFGSRNVPDAEVADADDFAVAQQLALDHLAVDVSAVGAVQVLDEHVGQPLQVEPAVVAADHHVVEDDVVVGAAAQRRSVLLQVHVLDLDTFDRRDELRHGKTPDWPGCEENAASTLGSMVVRGERLSKTSQGVVPSATRRYCTSRCRTRSMPTNSLRDGNLSSNVA